ncbi:hypothetical protein DFH05DRAFT_1501330 [Lentinula detonsa]|uniref:Uncharacterized protein n=1 Tax=Lentinula detonsa TaxID=2804962 RepID=A0A9W8NWZ9_9AGAR|nr:hypothetical protein DFH05DRAFT_1501330 [Lentinula detonsa]
MRISVQQKKGPPASCTVKRKQFPLTLAYAFTDCRVQGQTIAPVIIDIASPPTGSLNLFNIYVALSRSSGRENIRLLRDFNPDVLLQGHSAELLAEDDKLEKIEKETRKWWEEMRKGHRIDAV